MNYLKYLTYAEQKWPPKFHILCRSRIPDVIEGITMQINNDAMFRAQYWVGITMVATQLISLSNHTYNESKAVNIQNVARAHNMYSCKM